MQNSGFGSFFWKLFAHAIRANAVSNVNLGEFGQVTIQRLPLVLFVADFTAPGADWEQSFEGGNAMPLPDSVRHQPGKRAKHSDTNQQVDNRHCHGPWHVMEKTEGETHHRLAHGEKQAPTQPPVPCRKRNGKNKSDGKLDGRAGIIVRSQESPARLKPDRRMCGPHGPMGRTLV